MTTRLTEAADGGGRRQEHPVDCALVARFVGSQRQAGDVTTAFEALPDRWRGWDDLASRGFDDPRYFAAFLNTLR